MQTFTYTKYEEKQQYIRRAVLADVDDIYGLLMRVAKDSRVLLRSREDIAKHIDSFFVWEEKKKIIGCCGFEVYRKGLGEIRSLAVVKQHRKNGIGGSLINRCIEEANLLGIEKVLAISDQLSVFVSAGFNNSVLEKHALLRNVCNSKSKKVYLMGLKIMDTKVIAEIIGYIAAAIGTIMFLPQVIKCWKTKQTKDVSFLSFSLLAVGSTLWTIYGILLVAFPIIVVNIILTGSSLCMLYLKKKYG